MFDPPLHPPARIRGGLRPLPPRNREIPPVSIHDPITSQEIRELADAIDAYRARYPEEIGSNGIVATSTMRAHATRTEVEFLTWNRKVNRLAQFICNQLHGGEATVRPYGPKDSDLATALLKEFDIEYKDKGRPGLGELVEDASDYQ
jgi:hypothetical protein